MKMEKQSKSEKSSNNKKNINWSVFSTPSSMRTYAKKMIARWNKRFEDNKYEMPKHFSKYFDVEFATSWGDDTHLKSTREHPDDVYTICIIRVVSPKKLSHQPNRVVWYGASKKNPTDQDRPEVGRKLSFNKAFRQMLEDCMYWEYVNPDTHQEQKADAEKLATLRHSYEG